MDDVTRAELALKRARTKQNEYFRQQREAQLEEQETQRRKTDERREEQQRLQVEANMKRECHHRFMNAGGTLQEFEKEWPSIRAERLKQMALGTGPTTFVDDLVRQKRASGRYQI